MCSVILSSADQQGSFDASFSCFKPLVKVIQEAFPSQHQNYLPSSLDGGFLKGNTADLSTVAYPVHNGLSDP